MNRCGNCGKYPLCENTNGASENSCKKFIKKEIGKWEDTYIKNTHYIKEMNLYV